MVAHDPGLCFLSEAERRHGQRWLQVAAAEAAEELKQAEERTQAAQEESAGLRARTTAAEHARLDATRTLHGSRAECEGLRRERDRLGKKFREQQERAAQDAADAHKEIQCAAAAPAGVVLLHFVVVCPRQRSSTAVGCGVPGVHGCVLYVLCCSRDEFRIQNLRSVPGSCQSHFGFQRIGFEIWRRVHNSGFTFWGIPRQVHGAESLEQEPASTCSGAGGDT